MKSRISLTTFSDDTKRKAEKLCQLKKDYHRTKDADELERIRGEMKKIVNETSMEEMKAISILMKNKL